MARKVKSRELDTREARGRLKPRGKPYWKAVERGLHSPTTLATPTVRQFWITGRRKLRRADAW